MISSPHRQCRIDDRLMTLCPERPGRRPPMQAVLPAVLEKIAQEMPAINALLPTIRLGR